MKSYKNEWMTEWKYGNMEIWKYENMNEWMNEWMIDWMNCLRDTVMHGGHRGGERIPRTCWPPTDDEPLRYEFGAPPFLNFLWITHSIKGRHHGESLFWQRIPAATSIINEILPIISAEPALFGVYADDFFSRWRALRGFRNTLKRRPRVATVAFDGRYMG